MSSSNQATPSVTRGGTGTISTPANTVPDKHENTYLHNEGLRGEPQGTVGSRMENESISDKIINTSSSNIGKDTATKRMGISSSAGGSSGHGGGILVGKALGLGGRSESEKGNMGPPGIGKAMGLDKGVGSRGNAGKGNTGDQGIESAARSLEGVKEMGSRFLGSYHDEMKSELGE